YSRLPGYRGMKQGFPFKLYRKCVSVCFVGISDHSTHITTPLDLRPTVYKIKSNSKELKELNTVGSGSFIISKPTKVNRMEINMEAYMKVRALVQEFMDDFLGLYISPKNRLMNSLLIAAMSAEGTSTIHNIDQIDRGYQGIDKRLNQIGARITRI
ncbi:hypothetical protein VPJ68_07305, partial [Parabacteroides distasonis]